MGSRRQDQTMGYEAVVLRGEKSIPLLAQQLSNVSDAGCGGCIPYDHAVSDPQIQHGLVS